ncbi:acetyl-CoA carboxylase biotin carboxyl carrier protein [Bartonella melophagi]|uniref:Biotin carboxyl carrier protein of acetyl-CoA carboxylase n=1 Tax=Bartonella melophagi K-2C TaxID=1094557 RepID=J1JYS3_9HYPH|nr:acetyl-CoA carboxylase biotin carboxyl carrier protein [Bartonella melophagi]EJF90247.1 acetyl-CoA carboxylase, biotin carboxyl carrier protein [Bartonella melophagi K-2C]
MATKKTDATKHIEINMELIRDLAKILNDTNLTNIELEQGGLRIRVSRQNTLAAPEQTIYASIPAPTVTSSSDLTATTPTKEDLTATTPTKEEQSNNAITSPMVGTVYLAPAPGAQPFVEIGQNVSEGQTLLIIEAMKTMNHIPSPRSGTVTAVLVKDAQPVEFDEPLIIVE